MRDIYLIKYGKVILLCTDRLTEQWNTISLTVMNTFMSSCTSSWTMNCVVLLQLSINQSSSFKFLFVTCIQVQSWQLYKNLKIILQRHDTTRHKYLTTSIFQTLSLVTAVIKDIVFTLQQKFGKRALCKIISVIRHLPP